MKPMVAVGNSPPAVGGWKVRVSGRPLNAYERTTNTTGSPSSSAAGKRFAGELVAADAAARFDVGDPAGEGRTAVGADDEILSEEPGQAFAEWCRLETHSCTHFVRQQIVKRHQIGDPDLHLDHDLRFLDRDLDHRGRGHRLGDDDGVGERDAGREAT